MRPVLLATLLAVSFAAPMLAGCVGCVSGPPVSARGITDAPTSAGTLGGFTLDVLVTSGPDGAPLPGAGVVAYWSSQDREDWDGALVEVTPGRVAVDPGAIDATPEAKSVERAMTGDDGVARFRLPKGRVFGIVAAKDGHTEEWLPALAAGTDDAGASLTVPLFPQRAVGGLNATWGPGGASTGTLTRGDYLWDPHPLPFATTPEAERAYAARIVELKVDVIWANGPTASGDLAVGAGPADEHPALFKDGGENLALGEQTETATFRLDELRQSGALGSAGILVGAASDSGYFGPVGLPYRIEVEALLDTAQAAYARCLGVGGSSSGGGGAGASVPAWGAVGAVLALLGVASVVRRR